MNNLFAQGDRVLRALHSSSLSTATLVHDIHDSPRGPLSIILVLAAALDVSRWLLLSVSFDEAEDIQARGDRPQLRYRCRCDACHHGKGAYYHMACLFACHRCYKGLDT